MNCYYDLLLELWDGPVGLQKTSKKLELNTTYYGKDAMPPDMEPMTKEEELELWRIRKRSPRARELLVRRYLCWAFRWATKFKGPRLAFDEAVSAANAGLMEAMQDYQPKKGAHFTTYSALYIRRHLINALGATYAVKITDSVRKKYAAAALLTEAKRIQKKLFAHDEPKTLNELFERISQAPDFDVALMFEKQEDSPSAPYEAENPADAVETSALTLELREAMKAVLSLLERTIITGRHYLSPPTSFEQLGAKLNITKKQAREAHDEALIKLRRWLSDTK